MRRISAAESMRLSRLLEAPSKFTSAGGSQPLSAELLAGLKAPSSSASRLAITPKASTPGGWVFRGFEFRSFVASSTGSPVKTTESDLALRATGRPPSRTPLSESASAPLDVKASATWPSKSTKIVLCRGST
eukprot:scaffold107976_cov31-Phaeocystis_antarctica.AAC.1